MNTSLFIFETEHLKVRQYNLQDEDEFYQLSGNAEVMRYIRPVVSKTDSDKLLIQNVQQYADHPNTGRWAVLEKNTGNFVGSFSVLVMDSDKNKLHIGYALLPQYWGKGLASELLRQGILFFFKAHSSDLLYAITEQPNIASQKVLLKCGFFCLGKQKEGDKEVLIYILKRNENLQE